MDQGASLFLAISKQIEKKLETALLGALPARPHTSALLASLALNFLESGAKILVPQTTPLLSLRPPPARILFPVFI